MCKNHMSANFVRLWLYNFLLCFFGYFFPALSSAKAVLTEDHEAVLEWLTYWSVFSLFYFAEFFLDIFLWKVMLLYEIKILLIMWLTLPRFQGAFRIYRFILKPYFEQYEEKIDVAIAEVSDGVKTTAYKNFHNILYQLIVTNNMSFLFASASSLGGDIYTAVLPHAKALSTHVGVREDSPKPLAVTNQSIFRDFYKLLCDGIYIQAGFAIETITPSKIVLMSPIFLEILAEVESSKSLEGFSNIAMVPMYKINTVTQLSNHKCISHLNFSTEISVTGPPVDSSFSAGIRQYQIRDLYIKSDDVDQCEALIIGLQMMTMHSRGLLHSRLERLSNIAHRIYQKDMSLQSHFHRWIALTSKLQERRRYK